MRAAFSRATGGERVSVIKGLIELALLGLFFLGLVVLIAVVIGGGDD